MDPAADGILRAALALLLAAAARHKLADRGRFRAVLAEYRLLPARLVSVGAGLVIVAEVGIAAALVVPALRTPALGAAAALLLAYAAAIAINLARGRRHIDCGCAGPAARRALSGWLVARNAVVAAAALAGTASVAARPLVWLDALTVAGASAALAAAWIATDRMLAHAPAIARLRGTP
jgi:Methylamine utilisation protein MauE